MKQLKTIETVILVPGVPGNSPRHWQKWLADQCMEHGLKTFYPQLHPERDNLRLSVWLRTLERVVSHIRDLESTALVGHSVGCMTILQLLENIVQTDEIRLAILVSPSSLSSADINVPNFRSFFKGLISDGKLDAVKIQRIKNRILESHVFASDNDLLVDENDARILAADLCARFHLIPGAGHMGDASGRTEFPEILRLLTMPS